MTTPFRATAHLAMIIPLQVPSFVDDVQNLSTPIHLALALLSHIGALYTDLSSCKRKPEWARGTAAARVVARAGAWNGRGLCYSAVL